MLELPRTARFEFEFFQEKDRIFESQGKGRIPYSYEYSCWSAKDSCADDWLMNKTWFTFRVKEQDSAPEYRVEVEKILDDIRFTEESDKSSLFYPVILKEVSVKEDEYWGDGTEINQILKDSCFLKEEGPGYPSFAAVFNRVRKGQGIGTCKEIKSRNNLLGKSTSAMLTEASRLLLQAATEQQKVSPVPKTSATTRVQEKQSTGSLLDLLNSYPKDLLIETAEETGCDLKAQKKPRIAYELARHLLEPDVMRSVLLELPEEDLDAFEAAIKKEHFRPTDEDWYHLEGIYELNYLAEYSDDTVEVPWDVAAVYEVICKNGYRAYHTDARWLIQCLQTFSALFVVGPVKHLFRMYKQRNGSQTDYGGFQKLLQRIPQKLNPCRVMGNRLVANEAAEGDIFLAIEARQRDVAFYLPGETEIRELPANGYPASNPSYKKLFRFLQNDLKLEAELSEELCRYAFMVFSGGGMLSDYMEELNSRGIEFSAKGQIESFAKIIMDLNNHTRMFELRGHTPNEMLSLMPASAPGRRPVIVPMSSNAADLLENGSRELKQLGFEVDNEMTADSIPIMAMPNGLAGEVKAGVRKIYPNDPCPCGSGKKYKKCCGRKNGSHT